MLYLSATTELPLEKKPAKFYHLLQDSQFFLSPPLRMVELIRKKDLYQDIELNGESRNYLIL